MVYRKEKIFNLRKEDTKILSYIYHNNRVSISKISKQSKISRKKVAYNLNRYTKTGVIKKFFPIIYYSKLGYKTFSILLLKFYNPAKAEEFKKNHTKDKNWISKSDILGKYNLFINLIFKDETERNEYLFNLTNSNRESISEYLVLEPYYAELYPLKFLGSRTSGKMVILDKSSEKIILLDEKDKKILKLLEKDGRMKIIDIAKSINLSAELVLYKIRKLQKDGVLLGTRIQFDMEKLGYYYTGLLINFKHFSHLSEKKLKEFAKEHKHVNSIALMFSKPNCFIQIFHQTEEELRNSIKDIENNFKEESFDIEILPIKSEDEEIYAFPFL